MHIHRDDLIAGGTKRRALRLMVAGMPDGAIHYAGTVMGHGALALAHACAENGRRADIHISAGDDHPMVACLRAAGAVVHLYPPLPVSALYERAQRCGTALPPGFDTEAFRAALITALRDVELPPFSEIWTAAVTGTLTRALQTLYPQVQFHAVKVVKAACDLGDAAIYHAPEKYHRPANHPPPYPSCPYTDAKVWRFAKDRAAGDALIWNTAG